MANEAAIDVRGLGYVYSGGRVALDGVTSSDPYSYKKKLGCVPQEIALEERLTARENLRLFGRRAARRRCFRSRAGVHHEQSVPSGETHLRHADLPGLRQRAAR